jgi:adenylate kinase
MAPITEDVVSGLKDTIHKLESRVVDLESRLVNGDKPKSVTEQMRIILMGPPGAGKHPPQLNQSNGY